MTHKYENFAETHLAISLRSGSEYTALCVSPDHDDHSPSMRFNIDTGLYYCHSCGAKGNIKTLSRKFKVQMVDTEPDVIELQERLRTLDLVEPKPTSNVTERTIKRYGQNTGYWLERGFTPEVISQFQLGYDMLEGCGIIPVRTHTHQLVGAIRRNVEKSYMPKYMYPKGFDRKHLLFGSWSVLDNPTDTVVLTEGSLDAVAVWQAGFPAVAQFGSSLSKEQVDLLRKMGVWKIVLFYDHDAAGRKARDHAINVLRDFMVYTVRYKRSDGKDPGEIPSDIVAQRIENARRVI